MNIYLLDDLFGHHGKIQTSDQDISTDKNPQITWWAVFIKLYN